jgi:thiamine-monophosphate kinase
MSENNRTELGDLGEFGLIEKLTKKFEIKNESSILGIGDDAAIIEGNNDSSIVVSTDMLVEGVHFNMMYTPLMHLGYKSVIVNLSDIVAMNAVPEQITVSLAISNRFSVEALEEIYLGIHKACELYNVDLVGGDTTSSLSGLIISITAIGKAKKEKITKRSGAKEHDLIVVTGDLGGAFMGLQILEREKSVYKENPGVQPDLDGHDYILERQLKPEARVDVTKLLADLDVLPSAMIDISDGLASELIHICEASKVGCQVYDEKLPIDPETYNTARDFELDPTTCALNGGEDYELLFTVAQADYDKIKGNPNFTVVGHITDASVGMNLVDKNGGVIALSAQGWNHFDEN